MFIPADFHDAAGDIAITANGGTNKICYALFHEGTLVADVALIMSDSKKNRTSSV